MPDSDIRLRESQIELVGGDGGGDAPDVTVSRNDGAQPAFTFDTDSSELDVGAGSDGPPRIRLDGAGGGRILVGGDTESGGNVVGPGRVSVLANVYEETESALAAAAQGVDISDDERPGGIRIGDTEEQGVLSLYWDEFPATVMGTGVFAMEHPDKAGKVELRTGDRGNTIQVGGPNAAVKAETPGGNTAAEMQSTGRLVAGGDGIEGTLLLRNVGEDDAKYRVKATQDGLAFEYQTGSSGNFTTAMEIDPDQGTVRVRGGSVEPLE